MTRRVCSIGLMGVLLWGCRSYEAGDRAAARARAPERWAGGPTSPDCFRVEAPLDACFGGAQVLEQVNGASAPGFGADTADGSEGAPRSGGPKPRATPAREERWWMQFNDEDLNRLVAKALEESPQTRLALARVARSRALARRSRAGQYPRLDAELSVSRQRQVLAFPPDAFGPGTGGPDQTIPETFEIGLYSAQLVGTYEPDFFGRVGDEARAREFEVEVSRTQAREANLTLAAEVSDAWFELLEVRARTGLLERQLEASRARLELVQETYELGLSQSLEVMQQRREVATALARLATVVGAEQAVRSRIAALVGIPFEQLHVRGQARFPAPEPLPALGVPSEVVLRRPEVRAARQRLEAADRRVGAAIGERLPSIRLQGTVGFGSRELGGLFDHVIWSAAATVTQPLWHGGEIEAGLDEARAMLDERIAEYRDAVVNAVADVEAALATLNQAAAEREALASEVRAAEDALLESELLYRQGLEDFLTVIDAERGLHAAQLELLRARRAWLSARVRLHRALGGDVGTWAASSRARDAGQGTAGDSPHGSGK